MCLGSGIMNRGSQDADGLGETETAVGTTGAGTHCGAEVSTARGDTAERTDYGLAFS